MKHSILVGAIGLLVILAINAAAVANDEFGGKDLDNRQTPENEVCESEACGISLRQLRGEKVEGELGLDDQGPRDIDVNADSDADGVGKTSGSAYAPFEPKLKSPSNAPLLTFYMYRAVSGEVYPPLNVNTANMAGVLWYLHNEVVIQYPRKFSISKIVRMKVQMRATEPVFQLGMNFGPRAAFDEGQCTGPFVCGRTNIGEGGILRPKLCLGVYEKGNSVGMTSPVTGKDYAGPYEWDQFGYFVGCNKLGNYPFPEYPVQYPGANWYTLPGTCPTKKFAEADEACRAREPGGYCKGVPTGAGDCTWNYEIMGEVSVDELVGMSASQLNSAGGREYDPNQDRGIGMSWWNGINSTEANLHRIALAEALFKKKYPKQPTDKEMGQPPCDFNFGEFYKEFYWKDARSGKCEDAKPGSACHTAVQWSMTDGFAAHPDWFPRLTAKSTFKEFQRLLFMQGKAACLLRPCFKDEGKDS